RDFHVTGVQTCALPIWISAPLALTLSANSLLVQKCSSAEVAVTKAWLLPRNVPLCSPGSHWSSSRRRTTTAKGRPKPLRDLERRSEERRVGKEGRTRCW